MTQKYEPVEWTDETPTQPGTLINKARLDQMQSAHHFADGFEEVDAIPTEDPGTDYHKMVYCTADSTFYRWDGNEWTADIDDDTKRLLEEHEADHANPHQVTKAQVGLGNVDNTSDANKPVSTATAAAIKLVQDYLDAHEANHSNPHQVTKAQVGLGNADNTADLDKPISTATAAALAGKVGTTGNQSISGSKTFMADTNNTFLLKGETALGAEMKIGSEATGSDPLGLIQFVKLPTLATVAEIGSDAAGLLTLSGSTGVTIHDQRAYNASNTDDVVTIGTLATPLALKANDNTVVHLTGDEVLSNGVKANTTAGSSSASNTKDVPPRFVVQSTGFDRTALQGVNRHYPVAGLNDKNGKPVAKLNISTTDTIINTYLQAIGIDETQATLELAKFDRATHTWEPTMANNALDAYLPMVRTTGNQNIAGNKTFTQNMIAQAGILIGEPGSTAGSWGPEIYGATPFIDFHHGSVGIDYSARIITPLNGALSFQVRKDDGTSQQNIHFYADGYLTAPNRAYDPTHTADVVTLGLLDGYTPMVRTSGDQEISGTKRFTGRILNRVCYVKNTTGAENPVPIFRLSPATKNDKYVKMVLFMGGRTTPTSITEVTWNNTTLTKVDIVGSQSKPFSIMADTSGNYWLCVTIVANNTVNAFEMMALRNAGFDEPVWPIFQGETPDMTGWTTVVAQT